MDKELANLLKEKKHYLTEYHRKIIASQLSGKSEEQMKMMNFIKNYSGTKDIDVMDYLDLLMEPYTQKALVVVLKRVPGMNTALAEMYAQELHKDRWKEERLIQFVEDIDRVEVDDIVEYINGPLWHLGELRNSLRSVADAYFDFVCGIMNLLEEDIEQAERMIQYIKDNPKAKTDGCLDFLREYIDSLEEEDE